MIEPLEPELAALLAEERTRPGPEPACAQRVFARASATLGLVPGPGGGGEGGSGPSEPTPDASAAAGSGAGQIAQSLAPQAPSLAPAGLVLGVGTKVGLGMLAGTVLGASLTLATQQFTRPEPARSLLQAQLVPRQAERLAATPAPAASMDDLEAVSAESLAKEAPSSASPRAVKQPTGDDALSSERALVARARQALSRERPEQALAALDEHRRRYPNGRLRQERDSLRVQALISAGQSGAAEREAAAFSKTYPRSLLKRGVEEAVRKNLTDSASTPQAQE